jgi:probable phosphoglycerate mutase
LGVKNIYIIRHGQTAFNLKGIVQGSGVDSSLNETGVAQAQAFFDKYCDIKFDKIYTSFLKRSVESIQKFKDNGIPHEQILELNEISWGIREGQVITIEEDKYYHKMLSDWREGKTQCKIEGGESPEDVLYRQKKAISHIMSQENETTILICMHGRAIRILMTLLLNYPLRKMDLFQHENLCLYKLAHTGTMFSVEKYSDTKHLKSLNRLD